MKIEKRRIYTQVKAQIDEKEAELKLAIDDAERSRDSDTKSSAGDKHETSRAMAQIEIEHLIVQLQRVLQSKDILEKMNMDDGMTNAQLGSLISTDSGEYFLSIGLGPLKLDVGTIIYVVSPQSPIGERLLGKSEGDSIMLNGREIHILEVR